MYICVYVYIPRVVIWPGMHDELAFHVVIEVRLQFLAVGDRALGLRIYSSRSDLPSRVGVKNVCTRSKHPAPHSCSTQQGTLTLTLTAGHTHTHSRAHSHSHAPVAPLVAPTGSCSA